MKRNYRKKQRKEVKTYDVEARNRLKLELCEELEYRCALSGKKATILDMHEWLVKRSDCPLKDQDKIFHKFNCIILSREQHGRDDGVRRDYECALWAIKKYGRQEISDWIETLELKTFKSFDQWLASHESRLNIAAEDSLV